MKSAPPEHPVKNIFGLLTWKPSTADKYHSDQGENYLWKPIWRKQKNMFFFNRGSLLLL